MDGREVRGGRLVDATELEGAGFWPVGAEGEGRGNRDCVVGEISEGRGPRGTVEPRDSMETGRRRVEGGFVMDGVDEEAPWSAADWGFDGVSWMLAN